MNVTHQDQFDIAWQDMRGHIPRVCHDYIEQSSFIPYIDKFSAAWMGGVEHFRQISVEGYRYKPSLERSFYEIVFTSVITSETIRRVG